MQYVTRFNHLVKEINYSDAQSVALLHQTNSFNLKTILYATHNMEKTRHGGRFPGSKYFYCIGRGRRQL
jgi:hypothetical protein